MKREAVHGSLAANAPEGAVRITTFMLVFACGCSADTFELLGGDDAGSDVFLDTLQENVKDAATSDAGREAESGSDADVSETEAGCSSPPFSSLMIACPTMEESCVVESGITCTTRSATYPWDVACNSMGGLAVSCGGPADCASPHACCLNSGGGLSLEGGCPNIVDVKTTADVVDYCDPSGCGGLNLEICQSNSDCKSTETCRDTVLSFGGIKGTTHFGVCQ